MNCDKCRELLSEYIDGRLGVEDSSAVAAHLEDCARCRALDRELRASIALLGDLEVKSPPAGFADSVTSRLERRMLLDAPMEPEKARRTLRPLPLAGMGLAAAAAILAAVYVLHTPSPTTVAPAAPLSSQATPATGTVAEIAAAQPVDALRGATVNEQAGAGSAALDAETSAKDSGLIDTGPAVAAAKERERLAKEAAPAAQSLGVAYDMKTAPAKPAAAPAEEAMRPIAQAPASVAAASDAIGTKLQSEGEMKAKAVAGTAARRETADKLLERPVASPPSAVAAPTGSVAHNGVAVVADAAEQVFSVSSTDSAIAAAYGLVRELPSAGKRPLPQGAVNADLLRYAAFQRSATVLEASDDKAVLEVTLPSSAVAVLRDGVTRGVSGSNQPRLAQKKAEEAAKGASAASADSGSGDVKVRFVFERATPAAQ